jgi:hypothetical protein
MKNDRTKHEGSAVQKKSRRQGASNKPLGCLVRRGRKGIKEHQAPRAWGRGKGKLEITNVVNNLPKRRLGPNEAGNDNQPPKSPINTLALFEIFMARHPGKKIRSVREQIAFARGYATAWAHFTNHKAGERVFDWLHKHALVLRCQPNE